MNTIIRLNKKFEKSIEKHEKNIKMIYQKATKSYESLSNLSSVTKLRN